MNPFPTLAKLALTTLFATPLVAAAASGGEGDFLSWKDRTWSLDEARVHLADATAEELDAWRPWCAERGYVVELDADGRVLIVLSEKRKQREKLMAEAHEATALFDALLPTPERDPNETFLTPSWGRGQHVPDQGPVALALVESAPEFDSLLAVLERTDPSLTGRILDRKGPAFFSGQAQAGAIQSAPDGFELGTVWRAENELVNRLTRLLLHRRFGELPYWLDMGMAWYVEQEVRGDLYSFPGRDEFVSIHDHDGWKNDLKREFKKRRKEPLTLEEFANWRPGTWDQDKVAISWGFARFLAQHPKKPLSAICEDLRLDVKENSVVTHDDGTWELVAGYRPSLETQHAILVRHLGEDYLEAASAYFKKGVR